MAQGYVYEDDVNGWRPMTAADLPSSGVAAGIYGDATHVGQVTVDSHGLVTAAANVAISAGSGTISLINSPGGTITVTNPAGPTTSIDLPNSGVTAGTYGDASHVARFTVSADGVITGAASIGISGVAGSGLSQLFDSTLGVDTAAIDTGAGGIAGGHSHLIVIFYGRGDAAGTDPGVNVTVNNDTGANYDWQQILASNTALSGTQARAATNWPLDMIGTNASDSYASTSVLIIPAYDQTSWWKSGIVIEGEPFSQSTQLRVWTYGIGWRSTAAITRMAWTAASGKLKAGSRLTIYGTQ